MVIEHSWRESTLPLGSILLPRRTSESYERELHENRSTMAWLRQSITEEETLLGLKNTQLQQQEIQLEQQRLLTNECDHRLMNDLQMIVSLLSMQSRAAASPEAASQLAAAANRVATIERIHRRLHFLDGVQSVAFKQYLEKFCGEFSVMLSPSDDPEHVISVEGIEADLPTAKAIPLSFVVNELITNAVKHGGNHIVVKLERPTDDHYALSVSNDGPALPGDFNPADSKGLGMKIVHSFVDKIGGQLLFGRNSNERGACFTVLFLKGGAQTPSI